MAQRQTQTKGRIVLAITHTSCVTRATGHQETGAGCGEHLDFKLSVTEQSSESDIQGEQALFGPAQLAKLWHRLLATNKWRADCDNSKTCQCNPTRIEPTGQGTMRGPRVRLARLDGPREDRAAQSSTGAQC